MLDDTTLVFVYGHCRYIDWDVTSFFFVRVDAAASTFELLGDPLDFGDPRVFRFIGATNKLLVDEVDGRSRVYRFVSNNQTDRPFALEPEAEFYKADGWWADSFVELVDKQAFWLDMSACKTNLDGLRWLNYVGHEPSDATTDILVLPPSLVVLESGNVSAEKTLRCEQLETSDNKLQVQKTQLSQRYAIYSNLRLQK